MERIFIAHGKADPDEVLIEYKRIVDEAIRRTGIPGESVLGRDDYNARQANEGGWDAWARSVATGVDFTTRKPRFSAIVVPNRVVGKATAEMVTMAIGAGKPVWVIERGQFVAAKGVMRNRGANLYRAGFTVFALLLALAMPARGDPDTVGDPVDAPDEQHGGNGCVTSTSRSSPTRCCWAIVRTSSQASGRRN